MVLRTRGNKTTSEGQLTAASPLSDEITVLIGSSAQGTTGLDLSLLFEASTPTDSVVLERIIGFDQTTFGPMESYDTNIEKRVNQYTASATYRLRLVPDGSVAVDTVNYVLAK